MTALSIIALCFGLLVFAISHDPTAMLHWVDALQWAARKLEVRAKSIACGQAARAAMREVYRREL